jgi:hypothetical protein
LGRAKQLIREDAKKESTNESSDAEEEPVIGPNANISLLDQHSRLKQEALGEILHLVLIG